MRPTNSLCFLPTIEFQRKRFNVRRLAKEDPNENIEYWKNIIQHDTVLRKDGYLCFLVEITAVEIFEE